MFKGAKYIYGDKIIKCTQSGVLGGGDYFLKKCSDSQVCSNDMTCYSGIDQQKYNVVGNYIFDRQSNGVTNTFTSVYNYYDSDTHKHLGDYLRCVRDIFGVNMMPYYNCYCGQCLDGDVNGNDKNKYKTYIVPIKFNTSYTVAIECNRDMKCYPTMIGQYGQLEQVELSNTCSLQSQSFSSPFIFKTMSVDDRQIMFERYLNLAIQVPYNHKFPPVVIEGDYTNLPYNERKVHNMSQNDVFEQILNQNKLSIQEQDKTYMSKLSLLAIGHKKQYAFSNRLIENLLRNVIDRTDTTEGNIPNIYRRLKIDQEDYVWDNELRQRLFYDYMKSSSINSYYKFDISGAVDKDLENYLVRERYGKQ